MEIKYSLEKSQKLQKERGINFEDIIRILGDETNILAILPNNTYPHQKLYILKVEKYAYVVPFVIDTNKISFLVANTLRYISNNKT